MERIKLRKIENFEHFVLIEGNFHGESSFTRCTIDEINFVWIESNSKRRIDGELVGKLEKEYNLQKEEINKTFFETCKESNNRQLSDSTFIFDIINVERMKELTTGISFDGFNVRVEVTEGNKLVSIANFSPHKVKIITNVPEHKERFSMLVKKWNHST